MHVKFHVNSKSDNSGDSTYEYGTTPRIYCIQEIPATPNLVFPEVAFITVQEIHHFRLEQL